MAKLDRNRDFGTISTNPDGRCYEQDGHYFDSNGDEIGGQPAPVKAATKTVKNDPSCRWIGR